MKGLTFQEIILRLHRYWMEQGCIIWNPHHEMVGAGTGNPATVLRVLGPEPWNVAYVEPSFRPDDGRFGDNPNRVQMHHQYQVILKPPPADTQELYLRSLEALDLDLSQHDVRFVEDNWESPALGAWGLGWEVWLDGMEITQFTYFQQAGGQVLDPPACELTYGLERIAMYLQGVPSLWELRWDNRLSYADILKTQEIEFCEYDFNRADIERIQGMFDIAAKEAAHCINQGLVMPAHDYVLRCSHAFNVLDARGVVGLSERVKYFGQMRDLARQVSDLFCEQRKKQEFPLLKYNPPPVVLNAAPHPTEAAAPQTFLLEFGFEELAAREVMSLVEQVRARLEELLAEAGLQHGEISVHGTPRRIAALVHALQARQESVTNKLRGPARAVCERSPQALEGFCRKAGVTKDQVRFEADEKGSEYAAAEVFVPGKTAGEVLSGLCPRLFSSLRWAGAMRWLGSAQYGEAAKTACNRPLRWIVALYGPEQVSFACAGIVSGRESRGLRCCGSPAVVIPSADHYDELMRAQKVIVDPKAREARIREQALRTASAVNGRVQMPDGLVEEIVQLVEQPAAFLGRFDARYLQIPAPVLIATLEKHTRCFPLFDPEGKLLPCFVGISNSTGENLDTVRVGYERVVDARYSDAEFFYGRDREKKLEDFLKPIQTLLFHAKIGSMFDKGQRLVRLVEALRGQWPRSVDGAALQRAAQLSKADLGSQMVTEMTSLAGEMGRVYAREKGESAVVAEALYEQYLPKVPGGQAPKSQEGLVLSVADKLDTLCALLSIGLEPTGSADPFALRREALNLVWALWASGTHLSLRQAAAASAALIPGASVDETVERLIRFVSKRLEVLLRDKQLRHDVIRAVLARSSDDPLHTRELAEELDRILRDQGRAEEIKLSTQAYLRCARLMPYAEKQKAVIATTVQEELFKDEEERTLWRELHGLPADANPKFTFEAFYRRMGQLTPAITRFFDKVMVMDKDEAVRANRLAVVQKIVALASPYADLLELQGFA